VLGVVATTLQLRIGLLYFYQRVMLRADIALEALYPLPASWVERCMGGGGGGGEGGGTFRSNLS